MISSRLSALLAVAALAVALSPIACAATTEEDPVSSPTEEGAAEDELRALSIFDADDGKTVTVVKGQNLLVKLQSNPSTGYKWVVTSTDRTFGYPAYDRYLPNNDGPVGSGGLQRFTWKTKSAMNMTGSHTVKLEYKRPWEENVAPAKTFTFTAKVVDAVCPQLSPPAPGFCSNGRLAPRIDANGCVTGYDCLTDCRTNGCGGDSSCIMCWAQFACVPNGAMC